MALCWAGLMLRFDHIERLMDAGVSARRDAWLFSAGGCEDIPDGSTSVLVSHCLGDGAGWMATLQKIPLLGSLIGTITGYEAEASAHRDFKSPPLLGGKSQQSKYTYHLACNEKSREGDYILRSVLCQQIKNLGLGFAVGDCPGAPAHASCD
jgi:hypothetical protein